MLIKKIVYLLHVKRHNNRVINQKINVHERSGVLIILFGLAPHPVPIKPGCVLINSAVEEN